MVALFQTTKYNFGLRVQPIVTQGRRMNMRKREWNFEKLIGTIRQVHEEMAPQASRAVNVSLTMHNLAGWILYCRI
jgi:hypothetical protein